MRSAKAGLQGLFAVYKPPGVYWKQVRDTVETNLIKDLNKFRHPRPRKLIRFLPRMVKGAEGKELTMKVMEVPSLVDHRLVSGPVFTQWNVGVGHRLDIKSSGVFVLAAGKGTKQLVDWHSAHLSRTYTVRGLFGKATDDFTDTGKLIEKTTFDHITREQLERVISVIQGSHHKALLQLFPPLCLHPVRHYCPPPERQEPEDSQPLSFLKSPANPKKWKMEHTMGSQYQQPIWCTNIDLKTQEAYELAVRGLLRPMGKSPPLITAVRCLQFEPPEFQLEIHCMNETQKYLRKIVHEIGLELKSSAVCTQVRRTRDGIFELEDALLRTQWKLSNVMNAIWKSKLKVNAELENSQAFWDFYTGGSEEEEAEDYQTGDDDAQMSNNGNTLLGNSIIK